MPRAGWLALGGVLAALAATEGPALPAAVVWLTIATLALSALAATAARRWRAVAVVVGSVCVLARVALGGVVSGPSVDPGPPPSERSAWVGRVMAVSGNRDGSQRATLELGADPAAASAARAGPWLVYATLPRYPVVVPGDQVAFQDRILPPPTDGSGFATWLAEAGYAGTVRPRELRAVTAGPGLVAGLEAHRRHAADAIAAVLPEPEAGLAAGILIGLRERVAREVSDSFTTTGLSHVVAISGWNIALVAGIVSAMLAAVRLGRRSRSVLVVLAIAAYTLLSGASASVVRAAVMGGVAIAARASGRPGTAAAALGVAAWTLLLVDPAMVGDIGFQLSVAATGGLLAWGDRISRWLAGRTGGRVPGWLSETMGVSLAAQLATLPLILLHFGRLSLVAPLANLAVAPLVAPSMGVSLLGMLGGLAADAGAPPVLLAPIALAGRLVLGGMVAISDAFASIPLASVSLPTPFDLAGAGIASLLVAWAVRRRRTTGRDDHGDAAQDGARPGHAAGAGRAAEGRSRAPRLAMVLGVGAAVTVLVGAMATTGRGEPRLTMTVLDVGQGDSILVEGPGGTRVLVDGGPDPERLLALLDARLPPWDRRLDLLLLTHPHEDHVAGLALLLERYRVARVAENGMLGTGPGDVAFRERLRREGRLTARLAAGDLIRLDRAVGEVRWPIRGKVPERSPDDGRAVNDTSVVVDIRYGGRRFLLTGDVEDDIDARLLAGGLADGGRVDVLKVAHHGSATASTSALLAAIRPRVAVTSSGRGNRYGHPSAGTIERLRAAGAHVLRTDLDGSVTVSTDGRDLTVTTSGPREARAFDGLTRTLAVPDGRSVMAVLVGGCRIDPPSGAAPEGSRARQPAGEAQAAASTDVDNDGTRRTPDGHTWALPDPGPAPAPSRPASSEPCYDPRRDDPRSDGRGRAAPDARAVAIALPPHGRRGRGRGVPGRTRGRSRRARRPGSGRERGPPARPGQGPARRRPAAGARPRPRGRRVAGRARPRRARVRGGGAPGAAPGRSRRGSLARRRHAGGSDRRVRGQAGDAAGGLARCAVRALACDASRERIPSGHRAWARASARGGRLRGGRPRPRGCPAAPLGGQGDGRHRRESRHPVSPAARSGGPRTAVGDVTGPAPVAWLWGDDAWSIDRAVDRFAARIADAAGPVEVWRSPGEDDSSDGAETGGTARARGRVLDEAVLRLGTATLFGGGTLVVVRQPAWIARESAGKARLLTMITAVPDGNALCFSELAGADGTVPAVTEELKAAVAAAGGTVMRFPALGRDRLTGWLDTRAGELGIRLGPGAGALLAERIGATIREGDIDRRRHAELANAELEKLALYRPDGTVSREDVADLVTEAIPGSTWAFLDAFAARRGGEAARLAQLLLDGGTPIPVLTAQIHRRLRELITVRDHLDAGTRPPDLVKALRVQPFRAQKLAEQAATWRMAELEAALAGLVDVDLRSKGISLDGSTVHLSDARDALWVQLFLAEHAAGRPT